MKITEYPLATFFDTGDVIIKDGTNGTKKMPATDLMYALFDGVPEMHNQIYRGKNLGSTITSSQKQDIANGTFHDLWVGDYWEDSSGIKYRIMHFDYYYRVGEPSITYHHAFVMPDKAFENRVFNATDNYSGYQNSDIYKTGLNTAKAKFQAFFSDAVKEHPSHYCSASSNKDFTKSYAWHDVTVDLPEIYMFGGYQGDIGVLLKPQILAAVNLNPSLLFGESVSENDAFWTKTLASSYSVGSVNSSGIIQTLPCSTSHGVRPYALIG